MNRISFFSFVFLLVIVSTFVNAQTPNEPQSEAHASFRVIQVDAGKVTGKIRSFQGLNGPPHPIMEGLPDLVQQYRDLRIDSIRTHDIMGPTDVAAHYSTDRPLLIWLVPDLQQRTRLVNAANEGAIFPDWNADPEKPESYHFGPSDKFIQSIREAHAEVYYRIGRSFGADYTALPDFDKFASVVKHIAMHYNQGWANGFHDNIRYWEFWNEEDLPFFWTETPERFYALYEKTAHALKSVDPAMKVGADALALPFSSGPYREGLIAYCASHKVPLDFYSWHSYALTSADPYDAVRIGDDIRKLLDANGFRQTESILSEWNLTPDFTERERARLQGMENAAFVGDSLIYMQDSAIDLAHFYRGDAAWMGLFGLHGEYFKPAYTFRATGAMLKTPERLNLSGADTFGFAAMAGRSRDGKTVQVLISNYEIPANYQPPPMEPPAGSAPEGVPLPDFSKLKFLPRRTDIHYQKNQGYALAINNLPWGEKDSFTVKRYRLTKEQDFSQVEDTTASGQQINISNPLPPPGLELIVLQRR
jgi:xylan 1,4-beta-xylosidase